MNKNLLLLHGALGSRAQFEAIISHLQPSCSVAAINFRGHGGNAIPSEPFTIASFAEDVILWMDEHNIPKSDIFGYSMGGFVGLYLAHHHPERVGKVMTLATKFDWNEETAGRESAMLNPKKILQKIPAFAQQLEERHSPQDWKLILQKTAEMMLSLGRKNPLTTDVLSSIQHSAMICVGDRDSMVSIEETVMAYRHLKQACLLVFPATPHPLEKADMTRLCGEINTFFSLP